VIEHYTRATEKSLVLYLNDSVYELYTKHWRKERLKKAIHLPPEVGLSSGREKTDF